jgi:hypothetical protein
LLRCGVEPRDLFGGREVADMGDQRVEGGPALGLVEAGDRRGIGGVGAEAIDGLGRASVRAAAATASPSAAKIRVSSVGFTGNNFLNSVPCGGGGRRL